jgi:ribosomal protein S12 methylthiotransferase accessory factor YcaO
MTPARVVTVRSPNGLRGRIDTATWPPNGGQPEVLVQLNDGRQVRVPLEALHRQENGRDALQLDPAALEVRQSTGSHVSGPPSWSKPAGLSR